MKYILQGELVKFKQDFGGKQVWGEILKYTSNLDFIFTHSTQHKWIQEAGKGAVWRLWCHVS